jgi:hypothetical protein
MPTGSPPAVQCSGTDIAGWPVTLNTGVYGMNPNVFSASGLMTLSALSSHDAPRRPTTSTWRRSEAVGCSDPVGTGGMARVGVSSTSQPWKNSPIRRDATCR